MLNYELGPENTTKIWKFRSVPELLPHARWLYDQTSTEPCQCKYCSGVKLQREITATLGVPHLVRGPRASTSGASPVRTPRNITERPTKRARKSNLPGAQPRLDTPPEHVHSELHADLLSGKAYRRGEVVWAAVNPPLAPPASTSSANEAISYWPGVITDQNIKIYTYLDGTREEVHLYDVQYLSTPQTQVLEEPSVLPLQAYRLPASLNERLSMYRPPPDATFEESFAKWRTFRPLAASSYETEGEHPDPEFEDAIPAYILAIRTSDYVTTFYRPDLEWNLDAQPLAPVAKSTRASGHATPTTGGSFAGQHLYQSLWWGSERIWTGDIVRIKPERTDFPPLVQESLRPPVPPELSAGRTALFLHVDMIHSDFNVPREGECPKVTGTLWEIVSADWNDPADEKSLASASAPRDAASAKPTKQPTLLDSYPLPSPPPRSKWRLILSPEMDMKLPILLIAGRYYPRIIQHPVFGVDKATLDRLLPIIDPSLTLSKSSAISPKALIASNASRPESSATSIANMAPAKFSAALADPAIGTILALGGLGRGWFSSMDSQYWSRDRVETLQHALGLAGAEIWNWFMTRPEEILP